MMIPGMADYTPLIDKMFEKRAEMTVIPLRDKQKKIQAKISGLASVHTHLDALKSVVKDLRQGERLASYRVEHDPAVPFRLQVHGEPDLFTHSLQIQQFATPSTYVLGPVGQGELLTGSLTIAGKVINAGGKTLNAVCDAIKQEAGDEVHAVVLQNAGGVSLLVQGKETGTVHALSMSNGMQDSHGAPIVESTTQTAQNAKVTLDAVPMEFESNTITDVLPGVVIQLDENGSFVPNKKYFFSVQKDAGPIRETLERFVGAYNAIMDKIKELTQFDKNTKPEDRPALALDPMMRRLRDSVREQVGVVLDDHHPSGLRVLSELGISVNRNGKMALDQIQLDRVLADPKKDLAAFFSSVTPPGFAMRMEGNLDQMLRSGGRLAQIKEGWEGEDRRLGDTLERRAGALLAWQERLKVAFAKVSQMQAQMKTVLNGLHALSRADTKQTGAGL